jgi:hypothetical protein
LPDIDAANSKAEVAPGRGFTANSHDLYFMHAILDEFVATAERGSRFGQQQGQRQERAEDSEFVRVTAHIGNQTSKRGNSMHAPALRLW